MADLSFLSPLISVSADFLQLLQESFSPSSNPSPCSHPTITSLKNLLEMVRSIQSLTKGRNVGHQDMKSCLKELKNIATRAEDTVEDYYYQVLQRLVENEPQSSVITKKRKAGGSEVLYFDLTSVNLLIKLSFHELEVTRKRFIKELINCEVEEYWDRIWQIAVGKVGTVHSSSMDTMWWFSLRSTYDQMPHQLKPCFLYCSLFPKGYKFTKSKLMRLWGAQGYLILTEGRTVEDSGSEYLDELLQRSFLLHYPNECDGEDDFFQMRDGGHDLAKHIARNECWNTDYNVLLDGVLLSSNIVQTTDLLTVDDFKVMRNFILHGSTRQKQATVALLPKLSRLRVIDVELDAAIELPESVGNLIHVRYLAISSIRRLPQSIFYLYKLQVLEISCDYLEKLPEELGNLIKLRHFKFSGLSIERLSDSVSMLRNLQTLVMSGCKAFTYLPQDIGSLQNLLELKLSGTAISDLPNNVLQLSNLQTLELNGCKNLLRLYNVTSDSGNRLKALTVLKMNGCGQLSELPQDIGLYSNLCNLQVRNTDIKELPESLFRLQLKTLMLDGCRDLSKLPRSIGELINLNYLSISDTEIDGLPESLCKLSNLQILKMSGCCNLSHLPSSIPSLVDLRELKLSEVEFETLPESLCQLSNLQMLHLDGSCITKLPSEIGSLVNLRFLDLSDTKLKQLPGSVSNLLNLETLRLDGCIQLLKLPEDIGSLKNLHDLTLSDTAIEGLPISVYKLLNLKTLHLDRSVKIIHLPSEIGRLTNLRDLKLSDTQIRQLPYSFSELLNLQTLKITGTIIPKLHVLDSDLRTLFRSLSHLPKLEILEIDGCRSFSLPTGVGFLTSLRKLRLTDLEFEELPDSICRLSNLQVLDLNGCNNLLRLPDCIGDLVNIKSMTVSETKIEKLPESICLLKDLQNLNLNGNLNLKELPCEIGRLTNLRKIELAEIGMSSLPEPICQFTCLQRLNFQ